MKMKLRTLQLTSALSLSICFSNAANAEDFPPADEFGLSPAQGITPTEKQQSEHDRAEIGGRLRIESTTFFSKNKKPKDANTSNGSGAEIYIDAKGENNSRALLRAQLKQGADNSNPSVSIDEAKIQFALLQKVFVTGGRQKIKFGTAKFFNPTDFLNAQTRDPFALDDRRPGIDALKIHVPGEGYNLYGIALSPDTKKFGDTGGYWRGELAFSKGEVSVSGLEIRNKHSHIGADASLAVGDFDVFCEAGIANKSQISSGVNYEFKINESDSMAIALEHYYNENGFTNKANYIPALQTGTNKSLDLGKQYLAASAYLAKPKAMSKTTLFAAVIENLNDSSFIFVPQVFHEITKDIIASVNVQVPSGASGSEFALLNAHVITTVALEAVF